MHRHTQSGSGKQMPLALDLTANPDSRSILRDAYRRLELSRRLSFEQVMSNRAYAIGVRNLADAIGRLESCANSSQARPATKASAKDTHRLPSPGLAIDYYGAEKGGR